MSVVPWDGTHGICKITSFLKEEKETAQNPLNFFMLILEF